MQGKNNEEDAFHDTARPVCRLAVWCQAGVQRGFGTDDSARPLLLQDAKRPFGQQRRRAAREHSERASTHTTTGTVAGARAEAVAFFSLP